MHAILKNEAAKSNNMAIYRCLTYVYCRWHVVYVLHMTIIPLVLIQAYPNLCQIYKKNILSEEDVCSDCVTVTACTSNAGL